MVEVFKPELLLRDNFCSMFEVNMNSLDSFIFDNFILALWFEEDSEWIYFWKYLGAKFGNTFNNRLSVFFSKILLEQKIFEWSFLHGNFSIGMKLFITESNVVFEGFLCILGVLTNKKNGKASTKKYALDDF